MNCQSLIENSISSNLFLNLWTWRDQYGGCDIKGNLTSSGLPKEEFIKIGDFFFKSESVSLGRRFVTEVALIGILPLALIETVARLAFAILSGLVCCVLNRDTPSRLPLFFTISSTLDISGVLIYQLFSSKPEIVFEHYLKN